MGLAVLAAPKRRWCGRWGPVLRLIPAVYCRPAVIHSWGGEPQKGGNIFPPIYACARALGRSLPSVGRELLLPWCGR